MHSLSAKTTLGGASLALAIALLLAAIALMPGSVRADDETVTMQGLSYSPSTVNITVGDTVTWQNVDVGVNHTSTSNTGVWDSGVVTPGNDFSFTFTEAGIFNYHCTVHGTVMNGTVVVAEATPTTTTTTTTTTTATATATTATATATTATATATTPATNTPTSTSTPTATATVPAATATSPATTTAVAPGPPDTGTGTVSGTNNALLLVAAGLAALGLTAGSLVAIRRRA